MKKLVMIIAFLFSAGSAFAGDAESAANAGYMAPLPIAIIAGLAMAIGLVVFVCWHFKGSRKPVVTATTVIATIMGLHAGDFADAADRGYRAWSGRAPFVNNGISALGRTTPEGWISFLDSATSNSPLRDAISNQGSYEAGYTAGAGTMMGNPGDLGFVSGTYGSVATGALSGYHYTTVCSY